MIPARLFLDVLAGMPGSEIRRQRKLLGVTAREVSELAGLHPKYLEKVERGASPGSRPARLAIVGVLAVLREGAMS